MSSQQQQQQQRRNHAQQFILSPNDNHNRHHHDDSQEPNDSRTANRAAATELERKLEMLEARFTMPLNFQISQQNHANTTSTGSNNFNSNNSNSPATLDAENSSPISVQSSTIQNTDTNASIGSTAMCNNNNKNMTTTSTSMDASIGNSQQSFAFDTSSIRNLIEMEDRQHQHHHHHHHHRYVQSNSTTNSNHHATTNSNSVPSQLRWDEITTAHIERVQKQQQHLVQQQQQQHQSLHMQKEEQNDDQHKVQQRQRQLRLDNELLECNDSQQCTIQTGHFVRERSQPPEVPLGEMATTKENDSTTINAGGSTPLLLSSPTIPNEDTYKNNAQRQLQQANPTIKLGEKKRKLSVPIKRLQPSVKNSLITESISLEAAATTVSNPPPLQQVSSPLNNTITTAKRTRLNFDAVPIQRIHRQAPNETTQDVAMNDEMPSTLSLSRSPMSSKHASPSTKSNSPRRHSAPNSNKNSEKLGLDRELIPSHSRDLPVQATNNNNTKLNNTKALAAITNNAKISDFFTITNKKQKISLIKSTSTNVGDGANENILPSPIIESKALDLICNEPDKHVRTNLSSSSSTTNRISPEIEMVAAELDELKRKYDELQHLCHDKDEQLKAVSNNRTILHTALQAALRQREQELEALQQSMDEKDTRYRDSLEEFVRMDAYQEAREVREKLATDGARLGRINTMPAPTPKVPTRMLMHHRQTIETWEDGYATKELQKKIRDLQAKKGILEERQQSALLAEKNYLSKLNNKSDHELGDSRILTSDQTPNNIDRLTMSHEQHSLSLLEVREAVESVRYHLRSLYQKERELALEEQTLNDEKAAHIRALKRVASEDASRFRTRPKLNNRYVLRSLLGKGGFSEVWLAFDLMELREVAVKIHQLDSRWPDAKKENYTKHVSREYEIHRSVRHPRIVSLYDVFEIDTNSFATVLELCEGTDLDTLLKIKRRLPERDARAILLQILSGMNYLSHPSKDGSRQGIIHYDLKPGNVMFDQYGDAKITDFGLSKIVDDTDPGESMELTSQGAGTYWYLPPECFVMEENVRISNKVDVWSIGVIFYQMLFGKRPFGDGLSQDRMVVNGTMLNAHTVTFPDKPEISQSGKEFIEACLTYDQRFRPNVAQICQHSYITSNKFQDN